MARRDNYRTGRGRRVSGRDRREDLRTDEERAADRKARAKYLAPWGTFVGTGVAGELAHVMISTSPALSAFGALTVAGTGAALGKLVSHLDAKAKRDKDVRNLHLVNSTAVTVGATMGAIVGIDSAATASAYALAGGALALGNNLWSLLYKQGKGEKGESTWKKLEAEIGLAKHEVEEAKSNGKGAVNVDIQAKDGATADELARKIPALASALKVGAGRITRTVDDDDSSRMSLRVQVADLLKEGVQWPGPSAFGAGFGDKPIPMGRYEDGEDLIVNIPGVLTDAQGLATGNVEHAVAQGVNGAGKTQGLSVLVTEAATRSEVSVFLLDCAKPDQDYGHVRHAADMWITEPKDVKRFFKQLDPVIKARSSYLAAKGLARWEPGCGLNFLIIICEEAADYADGEAYKKVLRTLRAAGGWVCSSIQRATHDQMDTTARSNHPAGIAFGLTDGSEASYVLPPETIEAGAWPGWGNKKPGYSYWAGLGIPEERWHVTARTYATERDTLAAAVTAGLNVRTPLDETTRDALGPLWDKRTHFTTPLLPGAVGVVPPQPTAHHDAAQPDDQRGVEHDMEEDEDEIEVDEDMIRRETEELDEELRKLADLDPEPDQYEDLTAESEVPEPEAGAPTFSLPSPTAEEDKLPPETVRKLIVDRLSEWYRSAEVTFEPKRLSDLWMRADLKDPRAWWNRLRKQLLEQGVIEESEEYGEYDIMRDPLADDSGE